MTMTTIAPSPAPYDTLALLPAPRFTRSDSWVQGASEVLAIVRVTDRYGAVVTSTIAGDGDAVEFPYLVQVTSGPEDGDDFVGLYYLDGGRAQIGNGWTWEIATVAPSQVIDEVETSWECGTSVITRIAE
jgi:hypothetical protein